MTRTSMLQMYSMYDNKAQIYNKPMYMKSYIDLIEAINITLDADKGENINPVDYEIYQLGEYDESSGKYDLFDAPKHMINLNMLQKDK